MAQHAFEKQHRTYAVIILACSAAMMAVALVIAWI